MEEKYLFFSPGNRLYQNIKFREIPQRQSDVCVKGGGWHPDPSKPGSLVAITAVSPPQRGQSLQQTPAAITSPFCRGPWESAQEGTELA